MNGGRSTRCQWRRGEVAKAGDRGSKSSSSMLSELRFGFSYGATAIRLWRLGPRRSTTTAPLTTPSTTTAPLTTPSWGRPLPARGSADRIAAGFFPRLFHVVCAAGRGLENTNIGLPSDCNQIATGLQPAYQRAMQHTVGSRGALARRVWCGFGQNYKSKGKNDSTSKGKRPIIKAQVKNACRAVAVASGSGSASLSRSFSSWRLGSFSSWRLGLVSRRRSAKSIRSEQKARRHERHCPPRPDPPGGHRHK